MRFLKTLTLLSVLCASVLDRPVSAVQDRYSSATGLRSRSSTATVPLSWNQIGNTIRGDSGDDASGYSVDSSADGSIVAYGAPLYSGEDEQGSARVLQYDKENKEWKQLGQLIQGDNPGEELGSNVKLSAKGNILAVSSHEFDGDRGYVKILKYSKSKKEWKQLGDNIEGEHIDDGSGWRLSLSKSGLTVAIGAYDNGDGNVGEDDVDGAGHTRIYRYNKNKGSWKQMGNDIDGNGNDNYEGWSVDLSANGKRVVIGGPFFLNSDGKKVGRVRVFDYKSDSKTWVQVGQDLTGADYKGEFGLSVSMSSNGKTIAISAGCVYYCEDSFNDRVKIYRLVAGEWKKVGDSIYADNDHTDFANVVSLSEDGSTVAFNAKNDVEDKYLAFVYTLVDGEWSQVGQSLIYRPRDDWRGEKNDVLALSSDASTLVLGSTQDSGSGSEVK
eukprot:CAMPEP_0194072292 /NCGR_PEP_ID=MMETSP0149-20130528/57_1 /TAXON_ID=122233 /ORGANISM="Chaetoceros debilis, Strain MM31A-1" /LENGTH=440 /DNA_ID=CAMNT_0038752151 /DNA_START=100 /DNA_END=1422 /DNA_ORIENTATION=-